MSLEIIQKHAEQGHSNRPSAPGKPFQLTDHDQVPDAILVGWARPVTDGGSPVTGYLVEHRRVGTSHWIQAAPCLVNETELVVGSLDPGWRYQFRVRAENEVGLSDPGELSEPLTLNLQKSAVMPPKFTQDLQDTTALENEKAEFVVHFLGQPLPKICWFKDGFEIFSARRTRILTESGRSVLTIHQSALNDEGEIKCTATNRAGHASSRARLTLEAPPSIRLPRQYEEGLLFEIGEMMRLKVTVAGRPTPLLFWYHNGEVLQNSDRYEMKYGERTSSLKIDVAKRCDRGEYQIKAVNKLGEDTASFLVTVTDKPSPPQKARVVMTLGRSVTLSWSSPDDDGGCKIGNYIVEYFRVGWNVWLKAATSRQLSTVLGDLIEGSEYKFRVKAESPYGVSDPSTETETVFIPDPKRGLTTPHERSRSQPRDIIDELAPPIATRRAKPRSESASRVETAITSNLPQNPEVPIRPSRSKIKSPPKTPELSPKVDRKDLHTSINKAIFDRSSFDQELAYGSPDIKPKKLELEIPSDYLLNYSSSEKINRTGRRSRSPSPFSRSYSSPEQQQLWSSSENVVRVNSPSSAPKPEVQVASDDTKLKSTTVVAHKTLSRQNSENATGSSEFMLVLYPDGNEKGHESFADAFTFDSELIPPPLSLSAPELGTEPPVFERLRHAASSTELLQERTMIRLNKEAEEEITAKEAQRDRKQSADIPKIQINSQDDQDIVGLDRQGSGKRRGSFGSHKQPVWVQRRHSLRGPNDIMEEVEQIILKTDESNNRKTLERQKQVKEEKEPVIFEKIRSKSPLRSQQSIDRKTPIEIFDNRRKPKQVIEEYSSESESDDGRIFRNIVPMMASTDKEDETYHPGITQPMSKTSSDEPFEILTVKKKPPDPNFIPKPILKKVENDLPVTSVVRKPERKSTFPPVRSSSPLPKSRDRSSSLTTTIFDDYPIQRQRSGSLNLETLDNEYVFLKELETTKPSSKSKAGEKKLPSLTHAAQMSAITAAGVIIPDNLLQKKQAEEESKVLIEHYGDIVKSYGAYKKIKEPTPVEEAYTTRQVPEKDNNEPSLEDFMAAKPQGVEYSSRKSEREEKRNVPLIHQKSTIAKEKSLETEITPKEIVTTREPTPQFFAHRPTSFEQELNEANYNNVATNSTIKGISVEKVIEALNKIESNERQQPVRKTVKETNKRASSSRSSSKTRKSRRTPSKSPHRYENWSPLRSNSPYRRDTRSKSNSPGPQPRRAPKMREIMTQTSIGFGELPNSSSTTSKGSSKQGDMLAKAEVKVRTTVDYITDLTMLAVAFWFYVFGNELLALPFLFLLVFRQIQEAIRKRLPKWLLRMFRRKKKNQK